MLGIADCGFGKRSIELMAQEKVNCESKIAIRARSGDAQRRSAVEEPAPSGAEGICCSPVSERMTTRVFPFWNCHPERSGGAA